MTIGIATSAVSPAGPTTMSAPSELPTTAPPLSPFVDTVTRAMSDSGIVAGDGIGLVAGIERGENGLEWNPVNLGAATVVNGAAAGLIARSQMEQKYAGTGVRLGWLDATAEAANLGVKNFGVNLFRITPPVASALAGPALATTVLKPFGLGRITDPNSQVLDSDTKKLRPRTADEKVAVNSENSAQRLWRLAAGTLTVGGAAAAVFLIKPDLFHAKGINFLREVTRSGFTDVVTSAGRELRISGLLNDADSATRWLAQSGLRHADDETVTGIVRSQAALGADPVKNAIFTNRAIAGTIGAAGAGYLGYRSLESDDQNGKLGFGVAAGIAGAATIGTVALMPRLVAKSSTLAANQLMAAPTTSWIRDFGMRIAPITAAPAGAAAYQYASSVDDFDKITDAKSPFVTMQSPGATK